MKRQSTISSKICLHIVCIVGIWVYSIVCFFLVSNSVHAFASHESEEEKSSDKKTIEQNDDSAIEVVGQEPVEPVWYYTLSPSTKTQIIGYGSGTSQEKAETQALADITNTLNTIVERNVQDKATVGTDGAVTEQTTVINTISRSNAILQNTAVLKRSKIGDTIFIAMAYDTSTLVVRLLQANTEHNSANTDTLVLADTHIKTKLPFYKTLVSLGIERDFQLGYKNNSWYVSIGNAQIVLNDKEFSENFLSTVYSYSYNPRAIEVLVVDNTQLAYLENTKSRILKENQNFVLRYTPQTEEPSVYISLFYVHSFGAVQSFLVNKLLRKGETVIYPETGVVKVSLPDGRASKSGKDMILAVESKEAKAVFNDFYPVNNAGALQDSLLYSYGTLLDNIQNSYFISRIIWVGK